MANMPPLTRADALAHWSRIVAGWADHLDTSGTRLLIDGVRNVHDAGGSYEGVTRMLWGLGGWLSQPDRPTAITWRGREYDLLAITCRAVVNGTDPASAGFWGYPAVAGAADQRTVESGQVAFALWQTRGRIWETLSATEQAAITEWLRACAVRPPVWRNNWALFWALNHRVREALGQEHDPGLVDSVLSYLDGVWCGDGWYDDGPATGTNHFDDYNLWVFASHVLAWARIEPGQAERKRELLDRVRQQMAHVPYFYAADGAYTEYGRSLSYKFARLGALVWAYQAGCWPYPVGMLKRLVGRHLRWYIDRGALRADGTLSQALTGEGSDAIRETYISTGATYWAMQAFGALWSLPDDDPFWTVAEEPLPVEQGDFVKVFPQPGFVLAGCQASGQVRRFSSRSQHDPVKYGKFVYASDAGFNVGRADGQPLPDSMLAVEVDGARGHKGQVLATAVGEPGWLRFRYEQAIGGGIHRIETVILPRGDGHVRAHRVKIDASAGPVRIVEGGFPLGYPDGAVIHAGIDGPTSFAAQGAVRSAITAIRGYDGPQPPSSFGAPRAHTLFGNQLTPWLAVEGATGTLELVAFVRFGAQSTVTPPERVEVAWADDGTCRIAIDDEPPLSVPALEPA